VIRVIDRIVVYRPRLRRTWKDAADPPEIAWNPGSAQGITRRLLIHDFVADPARNPGVSLHVHAKTGGVRSGQAPLTLFIPPPME